MRIGVYAVMSGSGGGIYQYGASILTALGSLKREGLEDELFLFTEDTTHPLASDLAREGWTVVSTRPPLLRLFFRAFLDRVDGVLGIGSGRATSALARWLDALRYPEPKAFGERFDPVYADLGVDLMVYAFPTMRAIEIGIPYVMAIHDLQHRLQPEFPEVSAGGEWRRRERLFRNAVRFATLILADSEVGREDILELYGAVGAEPDQVQVLPFLPAPYLAGGVTPESLRAARVRYDLPPRYLFYPAQFWPHKNHLRLVEALDLASTELGEEIPIVFCGSQASALRRRTFEKVIARARELRRSAAIRYLGYVSDEDMSALYAGSVALIMPTFFGPTNIPILEAWAVGCPVVTSDLRGIREQAGDAALLVDPRSPVDIAEAIKHLWRDEALRCDLVEKGKARLRTHTPEDFRHRLSEILDAAKGRLGKVS